MTPIDFVGSWINAYDVNHTNTSIHILNISCVLCTCNAHMFISLFAYFDIDYACNLRSIDLSNVFWQILNPLIFFSSQFLYCFMFFYAESIVGDVSCFYSYILLQKTSDFDEKVQIDCKTLYSLQRYAIICE